MTGGNQVVNQHAGCGPVRHSAYVVAQMLAHFLFREAVGLTWALV